MISNNQYKFFSQKQSEMHENHKKRETKKWFVRLSLEGTILSADIHFWKNNPEYRRLFYHRKWIKRV